MKAPAQQLCTHLAAIALTIASLPALTLSQTPTATPATSATPAYAEEPVVIEHADSVINMAADGTGWKQLTVVARLQTDAAIKAYGVFTVPYASSSEHVEINYARVRHPDGTVSETQVSDAMDMPSAVTRAAPFYSDQKELQLPIRSLRVGDTFEAEVPHRPHQGRCPKPVLGTGGAHRIRRDTLADHRVACASGHLPQRLEPAPSGKRLRSRCRRKRRCARSAHLSLELLATESHRRQGGRGRGCRKEENPVDSGAGA